MDSAASCGIRLRPSSPVIQDCYLRFTATKSPSDCYCTFLVQAFFINLPWFIFIADKFCLAKMICIDDFAETVTHFYWEGGSLDVEF